MGSPSFMLNQDLASLLVTLAGQSILVSLIGITIIKLISGKSAPVRSLVCTATIVALGLVAVISIGLRLSNISWSQTTIPFFHEAERADSIISPETDNKLPFEPASPIPRIQHAPSDGTNIVHSTPVSASHSRLYALPASLFINLMGFIWLIGVLFQLLRLGYGVKLVNKFRNNLQDTRDVPFEDIVRNVAGTFWNNRLPKLYSSQLIESPITIGFFNPIVIIPEKLFAALNENELKSILFHELGHIYHHDQVIGVIKRIVIALYWWNPFAYAINRYHEQAREEVSDNYVLCELHPKVYTQCLMNLAEKVCLISNFPTAAGMAGRRFDLSVRVEQILSKKRVVALRTKLYLKAISFSICLGFTFWIAGLHASVKTEAFDGTANGVQETRSTIDSASIIEEKQTLSQKTLTKPEAIEKPALGNSHVISNPITAPQAESANKQSQESASPIRVMVSADIRTKEKLEGHTDSGPVQPVGDTILKDDAENNVVLSQKKSIVKEPDTGPHRLRGISGLKKEQIEAAISDFNVADDLDPKKAVTYTARGSDYFRPDQLDNAISDYNKAIEINPDFVTSYQDRGSIYYFQGRSDDTISDDSKALDLNPEVASAERLRNEIVQEPAKSGLKNSGTDDDQIIACRMSMPTGTRVKKRICITKAELEKASLRGKAFLRDFIHRAGFEISSK